MARLEVRVRPGARRTAITHYDGTTLHVDVAAPPVEGRANAALIDVLADALGLPKRAVEIVHGQRGRRKLVEFDVQPGRLEEWLRRLPRRPADAVG